MTMKQAFKNRKALLGTIAVLAILGAGGFYITRADANPPAAQAPANPAVPVGVQTVAEQNVRTWSEFSGRLRAVDFAEIRPEVSGRIVAVKFQDGQMVNAGDVLFVIDPQSYEAAAAKADADVASARTNATFAKTEFDRAEGLIKNSAIPQRQYDERKTAANVATASVAAAVAEAKTAHLNLDRAYVKAPISGRISRAELTVGNLVQTGPGAPLLTSIASDKGIYADFEVDEQTYMQNMRASKADDGKVARIPVEMTVQGDEGHLYNGVIESFDNRIDTASGTIRARARFDNEDGSLMPGMTVAVKVGSASENKTLLVSERAINNDQNKQFVYVVGADSKVAYRPVELGKQVGDKRVVLSGINAGDRVIVDGTQHVRPDVVADAKEVAADADAIQPAAGAVEATVPAKADAARAEAAPDAPAKTEAAAAPAAAKTEPAPTETAKDATAR